MGIGVNIHGQAQVRAKRRRGWTTEQRALFLDTLAATCNVSLAAKATGLSVTGVYALRRREPAFGVLWREAVAQARERLETELVGVALGQLSSRDDPGEADRGSAEVPGFDPALALRILQLPRGEARAPAGSAAVRPSPEATNASLMRKLDAIEKSLAKAP